MSESTAEAVSDSKPSLASIAVADEKPTRKGTGKISKADKAAVSAAGKALRGTKSAKGKAAPKAKPAKPARKTNGDASTHNAEHGHIQTRIPLDLLKAVDRIAKENKSSRYATIREALETLAKKHGWKSAEVA